MSATPSTSMPELDRVLVLRSDAFRPELPLIEGEGRFVAVVWPGVGAVHRSLHHVTLGDGGATVPLRHPSEAVYYVVEGTAESVDLDTGARSELVEGAMILVEPGTGYRLTTATGAVLVGGPCPPDPTMYEGVTTPVAIDTPAEGES